MKLGTRLSLALLTAGIVPFMIIGMTALTNSDKALSEQAFAKLVSIREIKKTRIISFFADRETDMNVLMTTVANFRQAAFDKMKSVQENKKAQTEEYFQKCFSEIAVMSNNNTIADALDRFSNTVKEDGSLNEGMYRFLDEEKYGKALRQFKEKYGFYDLLLIKKNGTVVYTLNNESDLNQNVITGTLKDTGLGKCFAKALGETAVEDFFLYPPSDNQHICFIGAPVVQNGEISGAVILKLSKEPVNTIVQRRKGMGKTGETYLAAKQDGKTAYRSDRIVRQGKFGESRHEDFIDKALAGESGTTVKIRSSGDTRLIVYDPLDIPGLNWAIVTSVGLEEVIAPKLENEIEDYFAKYVRQYGYHDLFLIHPKGEIFYSVAHEDDYQTNILTGKYADSGLGKLVRRILKEKSFGFADFEPYAPSGGKPSAFIAQPVVHNGEIEMIAVLQFFNDAINAVMQERAGLGKTEETYLVGSDRLMRSDSYLNPESFSVKASFANPAQSCVNTEAGREALSGKTAYDIIRDYNGNTVLSAYTPLNIWGTKWALIAEIHKAEALAPVKRLQWLMAVMVLVSVGAIVPLAFLVSGYLTKPLGVIVESANCIARGDFGTEITVCQKDEIGSLADAFRNMKNSIDHLLKELTDLLLAVQEGNLGRRGFQELFTGNWLDLVKGINNVIEAFAVPVNKTAEYLDRLAKGDIPEPLAANYRGDFSKIRNNLNSLIDTTNVTAQIAEEIASGNLSAKVEERSEHDRMMQALNLMIQRLNDIMNETNQMIQAVGEGRLDVRGNADAFEGRWRELVGGVNRLIEGLSGAVSERASLRQEMELARRIQTSLLPSSVNSLHPDFEIAAAMTPADQVGGDFYDIACDREGNLWVAIGDVSGHGVTPGLIMMMAQTIHSTVTANLACEARDAVVKINEILYRNVHDRLRESHFMTFTALKYLGDGKFQHAGAHLSMIVFRKKTGICDLIKTKGIYLNFRKDISKGTKNAEFYLDYGDILVLYTDGLTEAANAEGKMLDLDGLVKTVEKHACQEPEVMKNRIMADVLHWCMDRRADDMTIAIVRRKEKQDEFAADS